MDCCVDSFRVRWFTRIFYRVCVDVDGRPDRSGGARIRLDVLDGQAVTRLLGIWSRDHQMRRTVAPGSS